jgi:hypothetical protein
MVGGKVALIFAAFVSFMNWIGIGERFTYRETKLLVEFSRHGARASSKIYNFTVDPDDNFKIKKELTSTGAQQHYNMGAYIRSKYVDELNFLSATYNITSEEIYI